MLEFSFFELVFTSLRSVTHQGFFISYVCRLSAQAHCLFDAELIPT
jgi:hypothetical protein